MAPMPGPSARPPRAKGPIIAAACIALAVVLAAVAGGTYMAELWGGKTIPEVVGLSQPEAVDALAAKGFAPQAVEVKSDDPQGTVLSSDPEQGHRAEEGSTVTLSVAVPRIVPAIVGATSEEAAQALEAEGFTAVTYTEEKSNEAAGTVLAVSPEAGTEAKSGDAITVTVAVPYIVPDVEGMSEADAKAALQAEGYEVTSEWYTTEDIEEGTAVSTDPAAGSELNSGSEVTLYVAHSRGTELVDLTREILPGANLTNDEGSFKVENIKSCTYRGDGEVLYTVEARQYEVVTMPFGLGQERRQRGLLRQPLHPLLGAGRLRGATDLLPARSRAAPYEAGGERPHSHAAFRGRQPEAGRGQRGPAAQEQLRGAHRALLRHRRPVRDGPKSRHSEGGAARRGP